MRTPLAKATILLATTRREAILEIADTTLQAFVVRFGSW